MSELPARLSPGQRLTAHWLNRLLDFLRARELRAGPGIKLTRTPTGTTLSLARAAGHAGVTESDACVGMVVWADTSGGVRVRLYPEGSAGPAGDTVPLFSPCVFRRSPLTLGDTLLVHPINATATGEGEDS